jgi:hypothetical protein
MERIREIATLKGGTLRELNGLDKRQERLNLFDRWTEATMRFGANRGELQNG